MTTRPETVPGIARISRKNARTGRVPFIVVIMIPRALQPWWSAVSRLCDPGYPGDGLVTRTVYPTNPPRVDYELTERGKTLIVPLNLLWTWAQANRTAIEGTRRDFDQQRSKDGAAA